MHIQIYEIGDYLFNILLLFEHGYIIWKLNRIHSNN